MKIVDVAEQSLKGLFKIYIRDPHTMPKHFYKKSQAEGEDPYRIVCDYIAGMTDRFAYDEYQRMLKK